MTEPREKTSPQADELQKIFNRLVRRDWELWSIALVLLTLFAGGMLAHFYSQVTVERALSAAAARFVWLVFFGLLILVLLLNLYLILQKRTLVRTWRRYMLQTQMESEERERGLLDPLTQLYNRRFFDEIVPKEASRCDRLSRPLSFLLIDIDNFREVNQRLGHFVGDQILQAAAMVLRNTFRGSDLLFRFGADEFVIVLPETTAESAAIAAGRLQQRISQESQIGKLIGGPLGITIGQATYTQGEDLGSVMEKAEQVVEMMRANHPSSGGH